MPRRTTADDVVRARLNGELKREAAAILATIGLTPSDAYRMLLVRIVEERALPFDPFIPNEATIEAMRTIERSSQFKNDDLERQGRRAGSLLPRPRSHGELGF